MSSAAEISFKQEPPTQEDIVGYAEWLGIQEYPELYWIAKEGLMATLPSNWKPCKTDDDQVYYFNYETGESQWDHPMDEFYKELAEEELKKLTEKRLKNESQQQNESQSHLSQEPKLEVDNDSEQADDIDEEELSPVYISPVRSMNQRHVLSSDDEVADEENPFEAEIAEVRQSQTVLEQSSIQIEEHLSSTSIMEEEKSTIIQNRKYPSMLSLPQEEVSEIQVEEMTVPTPTASNNRSTQNHSVVSNISQNTSINIEDLDQDLPINDEDIVQSLFDKPQQHNAGHDTREHIEQERKRALHLDDSRRLTHKAELPIAESPQTQVVNTLKPSARLASTAPSSPELEQSTSPKNVTSKQKKQKRTLNPLRTSNELADPLSSIDSEALTPKPRLINTSATLSISNAHASGGAMDTPSPRSRDTPTPASTATSETHGATPSPAIFTHTEVVMESQKLQQKENVLKRSVHHLRKKEKRLIATIDRLKENSSKLKQEHTEHSKRYKKQQQELSENVKLLRRQRTEMEQVLEEMHRQELESRGSLDKIHSEYQSMQKQMNQFRSEMQEFEKYRTEREEIKLQLSTMRSQKKTLEEAVGALKTSKSQLRTDIEQLKNNKQELNQSIDHLRETYESSKLTKDLEEQKEITRSIQTLIYHKEELTASINVIIQKQSELNQETLTMKDEKRKLNEEITKLRQIRTLTESSVTQLQAEESALRQSIQELTRDKKDLPVQVEHLKRDFDRLSKKLPEMKADYESTKEDLAFINSEHESAMERLKQLKSKKLIVEQQVEDLNIKRRDLTKRVEQLSSEFEVGSHHAAQKSTEHQKLHSEIDALQQQKLSLENTVEQLREAMKQMEEQTNIMQITHQRLQASNQELTDYYSETKYSLKGTLEELQRYNKKKGKLQSQLEHLSEDVERMEKKRRELDAQLKELVRQIDNAKAQSATTTKRTFGNNELKSSPSAHTSQKSPVDFTQQRSPKNATVSTFPSIGEIDVSAIKNPRREAWTEMEEDLQQMISPAPTQQKKSDKDRRKPITPVNTHAEELKKLEQVQEFCRQQKKMIRDKKKQLEQARHEWKMDKNKGSVSGEVLYKVKELLEQQAQHLNEDIEQLNHIQHYVLLRRKQLDLIEQSFQATDQRETNSQEEMWNLPPQSSTSPTMKEKLSKIESDIEKILQALGRNRSPRAEQVKENKRYEPNDQRGQDLSEMLDAQNEMRRSGGAQEYLTKWDQYFRRTLTAENTSVTGRLWAFQDVIRRWQEKRGQERQLLNSHENWLRQFRNQLDFEHQNKR